MQSAMTEILGEREDLQQKLAKLEEEKAEVKNRFGELLTKF